MKTHLTKENTVTREEVKAELLLNVRDVFPVDRWSASGKVEVADNCFSGFTVEVDRSFAIGCSLYINFEVDVDKSKELSKDGNNAVSYVVKCEVSWSSTSRSMVQAQACIGLYSQLIQLGCLLESIASGFPPIVEWE